MRNRCYRSLAAAVINQAVKDATRQSVPGNEAWITLDALRFLGAPNEDLHLWCRVANVDSGIIVRKFRAKYEQTRPKEAA